MSGLTPERIAALFLAACRAELAAPKPGNVHDYADGHGMTVADFVVSAEAAAPRLAEPGLGVGARILAAVEATRAACGQNTNLGIVLLCAPLAAAAEGRGPLRPALARVLEGLDRRDAQAAYRAIRLAVAGRPRPQRAARRHRGAARHAARGHAGGGRARPDRAAVRHGLTPTCSRSAWSGLRPAVPPAGPSPGPYWRTYLALLAAFPDSHVQRKHGPEAARRLQGEGAALDRMLRSQASPPDALERLLEVDRDFKRRGINPGTTADLTVAAHFASALATAMT